MIVLDLPAPPSVNRTRRVDFAAGRKFKGWTKTADAMVLAGRARTRDPQPRSVPSPFAVEVVLSEAHTKIDLDNGLKWLIDYLCRIEVIEDDGPAHMRELVVRLGVAPEGCRVTVRPMEG